MRKPRFRHTWMIGGSIAVLLLLFFTDPDDGLSTGMLLLSLVVPIIAILFSHWGRKAFFDYPEADMRLLFAEARKSSIGAGLALIAIAIVIFGLLMLFSKPVGAAEPPVAAMKYLPILSMEQHELWPDHPYPAILGGLIEHESCITLRHARCWNPSSRLKTQREEGAGFGQITRAYTSAGALRFDALQEMRDRHPALREWTWANVYERPDLQLRAVVLKSKDDYVAFAGLVDAYAALAFADAAYNGGRAGVQKERRACGLKKDCDPGHWFGHVELTCLKSRKALYGGRSACDINRHHVRDVLLVRAPKYEKYLI